MNASCDTTRPLLRFLTLIATVMLFAFLWSGDQRIQAEIAAARAKTRPVYAGPSVMQNLPAVPSRSSSHLAQQLAAEQPPMARPGFLSRIPSGHYQLRDEQGNTGTLFLHSRQGANPVQHSLTIRSTHGELRLTPLQMVSASEIIQR